MLPRPNVTIRKCSKQNVTDPYFTRKTFVRLRMIVIHIQWKAIISIQRGQIFYFSFDC